MAKRVQILHISEFGGHSKAAQNIKEAISFRDPHINVATLNGLGHFYPRGEKVIDFMYLSTIKYLPRLWGRAYDRHKVIKALTPYRKVLHRFSFGKLANLIRKGKPDCFVATQAFPCGLIADFKEKRGVDIPLIGIVTDYHPHRFWVHPFVNRYVVACLEAKESLMAEGVGEEKIKVLGIPISVKFLTPYHREEISSNLGFDENLRSVLIMGGGLGIGPIKSIAKALDDLDCDFQIIVVCGKNKSLYEWFSKNKGDFKKPVSNFGYVDFIHKIMDFSDIIITKAGGITISEALAKGLCIVLVKPIPGQEERNVHYLSKAKAVVKAEDHKQIPNLIGEFFKDKKKLYQLRERAKETSFIDSSLRIVDLIFELIS